VGSLVALAESKKKTLSELSAAEYRGIDAHFAPDVKELFALDKAFAARNSTGAPGTAQVKKQLARWEKALRAEPET
jgi:argininosuccinate lyase